ncbi:MAG: DUF1343 domain-containing protein [Acidobacteria bacterium]|nr:MAG: DUF1343 domain-containing protein [Acidobacteriota bacterium]
MNKNRTQRRKDAKAQRNKALTEWLVLVCVSVLTAACYQVINERPIEEIGTAAVEVGLDRVAAGHTDTFQDKRIGLIVHAASVTADGRHAIDVFQGIDLNVVSLLTPEHGLRSRAAAGEHIESGKDSISGLPVISLYGKHRKPTPEDLEDLDILVFDLQGAGVRFYTYVSTLILSLEAAAENGLEFVVLDRPNPLGGDRIEGPISRERDVVPSSFVNLAPGPLVHGLTLGEMARFVNQTMEKPARLSVIEMKGWKRTMTWTDTGLTWVPPSPNLRSPEAALAYPGTGLLEATNVSEGRGTERPFLILGAPWISEIEPVPSVPGFDLEPIIFTPTASPAAPKPKSLDQECHGWTIRVTDQEMAQPYQLGVTLLATLSKLPEFEWRRDGDALTWLLGTPRLLEDLKAGKTVQQILDADLADHAEWRKERESALLY